MAEEIRTRVAGVTFCNEDGTNRQDLLRGMTTRYKIKLRDEASVEYPEAIGVYNARGKRLGFLPKNIALHIRECGIDCVEYLDTKITFVGATLGKPIGMEIAITGNDLEPYGLNKNPIPYRYSENLPPEEKADYILARGAAIERKRNARIQEMERQRKQAEAYAIQLKMQQIEEQRKYEARRREMEEEYRREQKKVQIVIGLIVAIIVAVVTFIAIKTYNTFKFLF